MAPGLALASNPDRRPAEDGPGARPLRPPTHEISIMEEKTVAQVVPNWREKRKCQAAVTKPAITSASVLLGFLFCLCSGCKIKPVPAPPPEVQVITVIATNVPLVEEWIGALDGLVNAQIRAQVTGYLSRQHYKEGRQVKTGDLLFQIDPRSFQAALDQALAKLAQDQAGADKTELDVKRYTPLAKEQAISQEELDNAVQAHLASLAQLKADQAAVENAQFNLGFTKIISPIDGLAGIALGQIGDLVSPSSGLLTTVSTINPIKVYFSISEHSYLTFWRRYANSNDDPPALDLQLVLSDGTVFPEKGNLLLVDRQVNPTTGTLQVAGLFPNPGFLLRPGQYGRIRAQTQVRTNAVQVPQRAVTELQGTYQVVVVIEQNHTNRAHLQPVKVGGQVAANWIIEDGLHPGDRVVVEGTQQAKEGTVVTPKPSEWPPPTNSQAALPTPAR